MSELDKDIGEKSIHLCKCGRKTLIKNHTKSIRKDGANIYSFHIVCPNCGAEVSAHAFRLEKAKSKAIDKWNKGEYKAKNDEIIQARKVGRPKMA
jgi:DNA-directed RNA polymerase subunit RPC12/RpoP